MCLLRAQFQVCKSWLLGKAFIAGHTFFCCALTCTRFMAEDDHPAPNSRWATWGSFSRVSPGTPCMLTTLPLTILTSYHHQQPTLLICNSVWNAFLGNMKSPSITALSLPIAMSTHDSVALTNKPKVEAIFATHCGLNGHENWKPKVPGTFFWEKKRYIIQLFNSSLKGCKL